VRPSAFVFTVLSNWLPRDNVMVMPPAGLPRVVSRTWVLSLAFMGSGQWGEGGFHSERYELRREAQRHAALEIQAAPEKRVAASLCHRSPKSLPVAALHLRAFIADISVDQVQLL
jgi:hypothetical protein